MEFQISWFEHIGDSLLTRFLAHNFGKFYDLDMAVCDQTFIRLQIIRLQIQCRKFECPHTF